MNDAECAARVQGQREGLELAAAHIELRYPWYASYIAASIRSLIPHERKSVDGCKSGMESPEIGSLQTVGAEKVQE